MAISTWSFAWAGALGSSVEPTGLDVLWRQTDIPMSQRRWWSQLLALLLISENASSQLQRDVSLQTDLRMWQVWLEALIAIICPSVRPSALLPSADGMRGAWNGMLSPDQVLHCCFHFCFLKALSGPRSPRRLQHVSSNVCFVVYQGSVLCDKNISESTQHRMNANTFFLNRKCLTCFCCLCLRHATIIRNLILPPASKVVSGLE